MDVLAECIRQAFLDSGIALGCVLHMVHIAAKKAAAKLVPIDKILAEIFHYFKSSAVLQAELKAFQSFYNVEQKKCLKHVSTRWFIIMSCVETLLQNWDHLKAYFAAEKVCQKSIVGSGKAGAILDFLKNPTNKLFAIFLNYSIKLFTPLLVNPICTRCLISGSVRQG
ncbi:connexin 27.5 [Plakobranchus ocellatus]|uniref:Connexin 27.5 n=1 Tax=Plakobranchus ocellatus TaxID=259542 RepID=A0AAV3YFP8_9GAST|nr:connexin 27.5 [Plakobranchus ocellatus]